MGDNPNRKVKLFWNDSGATGTNVCPSGGCSLSAPAPAHSNPGSFIATRRGITGFPVHRFDADVDIKGSVSKFWFEVDEGNGSTPVIVKPTEAVIKQDIVVFDPLRSSSSFTEPSHNGTAPRRIVLAVSQHSNYDLTSK